jgi:hypothetical protein
MPRFPFPEFPPETAGSMFHEPSLASGEGAAARESQVHPNAGGTVPVSVTPQTFGLGTGPARASSRRPHPYIGRSFKRVDIPGVGNNYYILGKRIGKMFHPPSTSALYKLNREARRYVKTGWVAHSVGQDKWVLGDASAPRSTSSGPQAGPSRASSSQATAEAGADAPHVLEDMLKNPIIRSKNVWAFQDNKRFDTFNGEKLPNPFITKPLQGDPRNRKFLGEELEKVFKRRGYEVTLDDGDRRGLRLNVVNPAARDKPFQIHVKLSGDGKFNPTSSMPAGQPYLVALVIYNPFDGALETLHVMALQHPPLIWRPYL